MTFKRLVLIVFLTFCHSLYGQDTLQKVTAIDRLVFSFDSCEAKKMNIGHFIVPKYSDSDTTRLYNRYILDTVKRDFYKCIYDCTFRGSEEITFYFSDRHLIKAIVKVQEYHEKPFNATYYFDTNAVSLNQERNGFSQLWSLDRIKSQAEEYLVDMEGIIKYLDKRKK